MICPDEGRLLLYLEGELNPEENQALMTHLASCSQCLQRLNQVEDSLLFTRQNLAYLAEEYKHGEPSGQVSVWENVKSHSLNKRKELNRMKIKKTAIAAAIVLSIGLLGFIPSVQTVAANFLQVFRVQQVDTLTLGPNDMEQIEIALRQGNMDLDLENFGNIQSIGESEERSLRLDELNSLGFKTKLPSLMEGVDAEYKMQKMPAIEVRPKVENVNKFLVSLGSEYKLPRVLDGQLCRITMSDSLTVKYPDMLLFQAPSPQIEVPSGVNVEEVAKAMVALPIWPDNVRRQLEAVSDWEHTLLIPTSENGQRVNINGNTGILFNEANNKALIWQDNGVIFLLEGNSDKQLDLVKIAESLR